jgi:hypothetical protein
VYPFKMHLIMIKCFGAHRPGYGLATSPASRSHLAHDGEGTMVFSHITNHLVLHQSIDHWPFRGNASTMTFA